MDTPSPTPMPLQDTHPMQFGVPLDDAWSVFVFVACLAAAIGLVYLFCWKKFDEPSSTGGDYVYQFMPRQLSTHEEYTRGFLIYFGTMAAIVLLLSLIGPKNLASLGITLPKELSYAVVPLATALVLVGLMPTVPILLEVEKWLRKYAHERAFIPAGARATAQRLAAADFAFEYYRNDVLRQPELRGVAPEDFTRPRRSLEHDWARLSCLVYEQKSRRMAGDIGSLDEDLLRDYAKDLEKIEEAKRSMEAEVAVYREEKAKNSFYTNEVLRAAIRDNLYKLYILLGCAVRLKRQPHGDIDVALRQFGFKLPPKPTPPSGDDFKLVCLGFVAASVFLLGFAAVVLGQFGLWTASPLFPQTFYQPFIDTAATLMPYGTAIMVADLIRRRAIIKGSWFRQAGCKRRANTSNYVRVALVCGISGYAALILWGIAFQSPTPKGLLIDAPNALLAMVTGSFYVYHLDNVEMNKRPSRFAELGWQSLATGICGLIAAAASFELILGRASMAADKVILTTLVSAAVGFVLAWYLPEAAAADKYDPFLEAKEERLRTLEAAACKRFGNDAAAACWIDTSHPALGGKSPKNSAEDVDGFEHAMNLLQRPEGLAA